MLFSRNEASNWLSNTCVRACVCVRACMHVSNTDRGKDHEFERKKVNGGTQEGLGGRKQNGELYFNNKKEKRKKNLQNSKNLLCL